MFISSTYINYIFIKYCNQACDVTKCGEFVVPEAHLRPCKTCNSIGLRCQENPFTKDATGVSGADFVLYVSAIQTLQCGETIGKTYSIFRLTYIQCEKLINFLPLRFYVKSISGIV